MSFVLGSRRHWLLLLALFAAIYVMGTNLLHVRRFALFALILLGGVALLIGFIVLDFQSGEVVTREPFDDASLPHQAQEHDEV
jgi:uncharacterized membrane protein YhaH (DUF805 family)